ncbi:MAG: AbrB/MazE/SpoVT family DNA-binding domain-containing protein [Chitinophagaceae bacterium]|jgi:antitoxin MazE
MEDRPLYTARVRKIGNSQGVLLSKEVLQKLKIVQGQEIEFIVKEDQTILLKPVTPPTKPLKNKLNLSLSTWDHQFANAIKNNDTPEKDIFEGMNNQFDDNEW